MNRLPIVQVQIVTYNSADTLASCLRSVQRQTYPHVSLVIVDNNSTDDSPEMAERYAAPAAIIRNNSNVGYAVAHNQGFALALDTGVFAVLTLNPDVELAEDYIAECLMLLQDNTRLAGVAGKLIDANDPQRLDTTGIIINQWFQGKDRGYGELDSAQYDRDTQVAGVCGAAALYSCEALRDLLKWRGYLLDESFIMYKEDVEIALAAQSRGFTFAYTPRAIAKHHRGWKPGTKGTQGNARVRVQSHMNQFSLLWAYHPRTWKYYFLHVAEAVRYMRLICETGKWDQLLAPWRGVRRQALDKRRSQRMKGVEYR